MTTGGDAGPTGMNRWWRVAGGVSMNLALGGLYAWSVFVGPLEAKYGWSRADLSTTFTIAIAAFAAAYLVSGPIQDRLGPRPVSVVGGVLVAAGYLACSVAESLRGLYLGFGLIVGVGTGFGYATPIAVAAKWFPDRRGLAVGAALAGFGGGSAIVIPTCSRWLIPAYGLPTTFRIVAGATLVLTMIGAALLRNPPAGYRPPGWHPPAGDAPRATRREFRPIEALRTPAFALMWVAYALGASAGLMVISQLVPFVKGRGLGGWAVELAPIVGAAGNVAGRAASGLASDAIGRLNVLRLMIAGSALAMPLLATGGGGAAGLFALIFAVYWCFGSLLAVNPSAAADFWGTRHAGAIYGMLYTAYGVAGVIGPRVGALAYDWHGSYASAFRVAAGLAVAALACELLARRPRPPEGADESAAGV